MPAPKVLLVEDEFLIRLTMAEALADEGFEVAEADSGNAAMRIISAETNLALMLTDIQLAGSLDGYGLARAARMIHPDLPVIFMTGRPDRIDRATANARDVFISKPYLPSEVCAAARRMTGH